MAAEGNSDATSEQAFETRDEEMERLRGEVADANNRVLMAQADLENFRKRMRRDFEDQIKFAAIPVVNRPAASTRQPGPSCGSRSGR